MQRKKQAVKHKRDQPGKHVDEKYKGREKRYSYNVYTNPNLTGLFVKPLKSRPRLSLADEESWDIDDDASDSSNAADVPALKECTRTIHDCCVGITEESLT